jgi:hypothetical protein
MPPLDIAVESIRLFTETEVAEILRLSVRTLQAWRLNGVGPVYVREGRAIRYEYADLLAWVAASKVAPQGHGVSNHSNGSDPLQLPQNERDQRPTDQSGASATASPNRPAADRSWDEKADAFDQCFEWLTAEMRKSPKDRQKPKSEWQNEALKTWPPLSKRSFKLVWMMAIKDSGAKAWSRPGAPKISSRN